MLFRSVSATRRRALESARGVHLGGAPLCSARGQRALDAEARSASCEIARVDRDRATCRCRRFARCDNASAARRNAARMSIESDRDGLTTPANVPCLSARAARHADAVARWRRRVLVSYCPPMGMLTLLVGERRSEHLLLGESSPFERAGWRHYEVARSMISSGTGGNGGISSFPGLLA